MQASSLRRTLMAIVAAGVAGAVIEMVFVLPIQASMGNSPTVIFQSIAAGALGKTAFAGGAGAALLGVAIHLLVSLVAAAVYVLAAERWDEVLLRRPVVCGLVFGALVYEAMNFGVIPLSVIGFHPPQSFPLLWASFAVHLLAFGLPISLTARAMLRSRASAAASPVAA